MANSLKTKRLLARALKELCRKKPFEKISVADIAKACGLNRQSFYYHFQDKYELLDWIYYQDNLLHLTDGITFENWGGRVRELLNSMLGEKDFYVNTLKTQQDLFHRYLFRAAKSVFTDAIRELDADGRIKDSVKDFTADFYAHGICGVILNWAAGGMKASPGVVADNLKSLSFSSEFLGHKRYLEIIGHSDETV